MPGTPLVVINPAPDIKGMAVADLRGIAASIGLGNRSQERFSVPGFFTPPGILTEPMPALDPTTRIQTLPQIISSNLFQTIPTMPNNQRIVPDNLTDITNSISKPLQSVLEKDHHSIRGTVPIEKNRLIIKPNKLLIEDTPLVSGLLPSTEPIKPITVLLKSKSDKPLISNQSPDESLINSSLPQPPNAIAAQKEASLEACSKPQEAYSLPADIPVSFSKNNAALPILTVETPSTNGFIVYPHAIATLSDEKTDSSINSDKIEVNTTALPRASSPIEQIIPAFIHSKSVDGTRQISLELSPEALGRVDILIVQPNDGPTVVTITVSHQHTLDLLRADQDQLSQALDRSGLPSEHRVFSFHLAEAPSKVDTPIVLSPQPSHADERSSVTDGQSQSSFGQSTGSDNQRRPSLVRTPYTISHSANSDATWGNDAGDPQQADADLYCLNITA